MSYTRRPPSPFRDRYFALVSNMTYETRVRILESQPELLAALKEARDVLASEFPIDPVGEAGFIATIDRAIAKAEGKETAK
jgi:hypothetical protein